MEITLVSYVLGLIGLVGSFASIASLVIILKPVAGKSQNDDQRQNAET